MAQGFQTQAARPPIPKYALPDGSYPTANINDLVIVEDLSLKVNQIAAVIYGAPHPKVSTAKLVLQQELESDGKIGRVRRIYVKERAAQDAHNYSITYSGESNSYPVYVRTYLERRDTYPDNLPTALTALGKVYRIKVTAGGSGYTSAPTVTHSGGAGSGFTATAQIQAGVVVAILITNCGTGYTSAPTIGFTGGGGTGATATAYIQGTTAVLVEEQAQPAPGELGNLFLQVVRVYETLPGPVITLYGFDPETGLETRVLRTRIAATDTTLDAWGSTPVGFVLIDQRKDPVSTTVATEITELMDDSIDGHTRTEYKSVGFQFPALFTYIGGWDIPAASPFRKTGPFPGVDYDLSAHRTASKPAEVVYTYSNGPSVGGPPNTYTVTTPGAASREFPIGDNTIHNAILLVEVQAGPVQQTIEDLDASTPTSYTAGTTDCIIQSSEERWKGPIFRKVVVTATE